MDWPTALVLICLISFCLPVLAVILFLAASLCLATWLEARAKRNQGA